MTAQYGKNHLGDLDEHLPTNHGFDEFFGNLYHLNAEDEPEHPDYPKDPEFRKRLRSAGVIKSTSPTVADRGHRSADQASAWRRSTRSHRRALDFMDRAHARRTSPSSCGGTRPACTSGHLKPESGRQDRAGHLPDGMVEHDGHVGQLLDKLDELGIADNTIVMYSTDNGAEKFTWPDGGTTPFRGEKNDNWEGGYRVPLLVRWPGKIEPGTQVNEIISHMDWFPTLAAATGDTGRHKGEAEEGHEVRRPELQGPPGRLQLPAVPRGRDRRRNLRARSSSTSRTPATCSTCATTTGRSSSPSSVPHGLDVWQEPLVLPALAQAVQPALAIRSRSRGPRSAPGYDRVADPPPATSCYGAAASHSWPSS